MCVRVCAGGHVPLWLEACLPLARALRLCVLLGVGLPLLSVSQRERARDRLCPQDAFLVCALLNRAGALPALLLLLLPPCACKRAWAVCSGPCRVLGEAQGGLV